MHDDKASNSVIIAKQIWRAIQHLSKNRLHNASAYVYDNIKKKQFAFVYSEKSYCFI